MLRKAEAVGGASVEAMAAATIVTPTMGWQSPWMKVQGDSDVVGDGGVVVVVVGDSQGQARLWAITSMGGGDTCHAEPVQAAA